jgi:5-methylcytosine-specific restriction endonuclease McrA
VYVLKTKKCSKRGEVKCVSEYWKQHTTKSGLRSACKDCLREYSGRSEVKERKRSYRKQCPEKYQQRLQYEKEYRNANKDRLREYALNYYRENREERIEKSIAYREKQRNGMAPCRRFDVLHRDNFTCQYCGKAPRKGDEVTLEVDHIYPRSKGGSNDKDNLITACSDCNVGKMARVYDMREYTTGNAKLS